MNWWSSSPGEIVGCRADIPVRLGGGPVLICGRAKAPSFAFPVDSRIQRILTSGFRAGDIEGILSTAAHPARTIPGDYSDYPSVVMDVAETLRRAED